MYCIQNTSYVDEQGEEVWHPEHMCSLFPGNKCDDQVKEFCTSKENCRRIMILQALGVTKTHPMTLPC